MPVSPKSKLIPAPVVFAAPAALPTAAYATLAYSTNRGAGSQMKIASVPYRAASRKILVSGGFAPSWGG